MRVRCPRAAFATLVDMRTWVRNRFAKRNGSPAGRLAFRPKMRDVGAILPRTKWPRRQEGLSVSALARGAHLQWIQTVGQRTDRLSEAAEQLGASGAGHERNGLRGQAHTRRRIRKNTIPRRQPVQKNNGRALNIHATTRDYRRAVFASLVAAGRPHSRHRGCCTAAPGSHGCAGRARSAVLRTTQRPPSRRIAL